VGTLTRPQSSGHVIGRKELEEEEEEEEEED